MNRTVKWRRADGQVRQSYVGPGVYLAPDLSDLFVEYRVLSHVRGEVARDPFHVEGS